MSSRLSLIIAASAIGLQMGEITPGINASFIIMAIITCFISPVLFNWLEPVNLFKGNKTIIVGGSSTGVLLARRLKMHGKKTIIVEKDRNRAKDITAKGLYCMEGDGCNVELYTELHLNPADFVVVETGSPDKNLEICNLLRKVMCMIISSHDRALRVLNRS